MISTKVSPFVFIYIYKWYMCNVYIYINGILNPPQAFGVPVPWNETPKSPVFLGNCSWPGPQRKMRWSWARKIGEYPSMALQLIHEKLRKKKSKQHLQFFLKVFWVKISFFFKRVFGKSKLLEVKLLSFYHFPYFSCPLGTCLKKSLYKFENFLVVKVCFSRAILYRRKWLNILVKLNPPQKNTKHPTTRRID